MIHIISEFENKGDLNPVNKLTNKHDDKKHKGKKHLYKICFKLYIFQ